MLAVPNHEAVSVISEVRTNVIKLQCSPLKNVIVNGSFSLTQRSWGQKILHGCTSDFNSFWNENKFIITHLHQVFIRWYFKYVTNWWTDEACMMLLNIHPGQWVIKARQVVIFKMQVMVWIDFCSSDDCNWRERNSLLQNLMPLPTGSLHLSGSPGCFSGWKSWFLCVLWGPSWLAVL